MESVLRGAEGAARTLKPLIDEKIIGGFDSPANYLPSLATQEARRSSLPDPDTLHANLRQGAAGLALNSEQLTPFLDDVEAARRGPLITPEELQGTSLVAGFEALIMHQSDHWTAPAAAARRGPVGARRRFRARQPRTGRSELKQCSTARSQKGIRCALRQLSA